MSTTTAALRKRPSPTETPMSDELLIGDPKIAKKEGTSTAPGEPQDLSKYRLPEISARAVVPLKRTAKVTSDIALQKWEGVVVSVTNDTFVAQLRDLKSSEKTIEDAEIYISEVSSGDISLLEPGSVFYWSIGYQESKTGQRTRVSMIRFRRLPAWSESDIESARREAYELAARL